jgi:hypothetical protein
MIACAFAALCTVHPWATQAQEIRQVELEGLGLKDGKLLFRGQGTISSREGRILETIVYADADGRETQRVEAEYEQESLALVKFRREYTRTGEWESLERQGERVRMLYREEGEAEPEARELIWKEGMAFTVVVGPRIRKERAALLAGKEVSFELIVPSRLDVYGFRLRKEGEAEVDGRRVLVIRMEPSAFLIRQLVDPILFYFSVEPPYDLLEYRGRTSVKDAKGDAIDARVVYRYAAPR